jgi:hypothetical protein
VQRILVENVFEAVGQAEVGHLRGEGRGVSPPWTERRGVYVR